MQKVTFRIVPHSIRRDIQVVEVLLDGAVCATITPGDDASIRLMSAHIENSSTDKGLPSGITFDSKRGSSLPIPILTVRFRPRPYRIEGGEIVPEPVQ